MKQFILNLLSSESESSSKRFAALVILLSVVLMAFLATFRAANWVTPEFMYNGLLWVGAGALGLTAAENILNKTKKEDSQDS